MKLISVLNIINKYSNKFIRVRRGVAEDGLILLYRYKTISSVLKVRKESW